MLRRVLPAGVAVLALLGGAVASVMTVAASAGATAVAGGNGSAEPARSGATRAVAPDAPPITRTLARQMRCKYPEEESLVGGGANRGVECRVLSKRGRQTFYVLKYRNTARAIDFWREWTKAEDAEDEPGYIARKGNILIIPMAGGSGEDDTAYTEKWATYAADKLDGRLVPGYPA